MKIGVISDTHGSLYAWNKALDYYRGCQLILHGGDILYHGPRNPLPQDYDPKGLAGALNGCPVPLFVVRGNCDAEVEQVMLDMPVMAPCFYSYIDGVKVLMLHGTDLGEDDIVEMANRYKVDVLIFGHWHTPVLKKVDQAVIFNPGSPAITFSGEKTLGFLDTVKRSIEIISLEKGEQVSQITF